MSVTVSSTTLNPTIVVDGNLSDWTTTERIDNPSNFVAGYALYGTVQANNYLIGVQATVATDGKVGPGTTIWLNTDQNTTTGYSPFGNIGAEYNVTFDATGTPHLYTGAAGQTLVSSTPLAYALSADGESLEIAIPRSLLTPTGGAAPASINVALQVANSIPPVPAFLPGDYTKPEYIITDPATLVTKVATHKVAIVYSETSASLYFSQTAYSDLIMAAENQARMAGVSYDLIDEAKLTSVSNLVGYDAIIFPSMPNVNAAQLPAIVTALHSAVYDYHISIITSGDFLTNDQTGAALPGNAYANMTALLDLTRSGGGTGTTVAATAADITNPIMKGYTAGQVIQSYTNEPYATYQGVQTPADVLVNQTVAGVVGVVPGVVETKTGGTNVHFATAGLLGDSNLLSNAIQSVVLGTQPGIALHTSRQAGLVAMRVDMDQSQFPVDVSPASGTGIYDKLIPILQQWKAQYNFVGSYYINIGDGTATDPSGTTWAKSLPYYQALEAMGGEIGNHSYTHLIAPPAATLTATTTADAPPGATQVTLSTLPSVNGVTVGMVVTGTGIGTNTIVSAVSGNTITLSYVPGGFGTPNDGVLADVPFGTTLTFSIPAENTNFLSTAGTGPFTYDYEFNQSKTIEQTQLGTTIYGAAIPGANETFATDQNILPYYQSVPATATTAGYTGYVTGGWTGVGSGYPSAIGYMSPTSQGSVYIAPNMTFDFTEIQYQGKTLAQAEADWAAQFAALTANTAGTPIVVLPVHDYGIAAWNTTNNTGTGSPYATQMYTDFIANAYTKNYEFVTLEQLASRVAAQQKASITYNTVGNTVTATVTPDPTAPDLGGMSLGVVNGGTQVIQNVAGWYAYNAQELFLPKAGGTFAINLGTTQDDVTHIASLPSRADLLSVTGNGTNLNFSMSGDGLVVVALKNPAADIVSIQGAPTASLTGNALDLTFADTLIAPTYTPITHTVAVEESATEFSTAGNDIIIGTTGNDLLTSPGSGNDTIIGNGGTDTIVYDGASTDYKIVTASNGSKTVTDLRAGSPDGTDTLTGIATIEFAPSITSIVTSGTGITNGNGNLGVGKTVTLAVNFNEAVTLSGGAPTLTLGDGGVATYTSGSGTNALIFNYIVASGQNTPDLTVSSFNLPVGVTLRNAAGGNADLTGAANYNPTGILQINTTPPVAPLAVASTVASIVTSGTGITNGNGDLGVGKTVTLAVTLNEAVTLSGGAPTLTLGDGGVATYASGSGTSTLIFNHTVASGENSPDLTVSSFNLPAGVIMRNAADGNVDLTGAANYNPTGTLQIDTTPPAAPSSPDLSATSDDGASNVDNITSLSTLNFVGSSEAGSTVTLFDGTTAIGSGVASGGQWSIIASGVTNGNHSISATATDAAGNQSAASGALVVTVEPRPTANYDILDTTTHVASTSPGETYTGPVVGLLHQY